MEQFLPSHTSPRELRGLVLKKKKQHTARHCEERCGAEYDLSLPPLSDCNCNGYNVGDHEVENRMLFDAGTDQLVFLDVINTDIG